MAGTTRPSGPSGGGAEAAAAAVRRTPLSNHDLTSSMCVSRARGGRAAARVSRPGPRRARRSAIVCEHPRLCSGWPAPAGVPAPLASLGIQHKKNSVNQMRAGRGLCGGGVRSPIPPLGCMFSFFLFRGGRGGGVQEGSPPPRARVIGKRARAPGGLGGTVGQQREIFVAGGLDREESKGPPGGVAKKEWRLLSSYGSAI